MKKNTKVFNKNVMDRDVCEKYRGEMQIAIITRLNDFGSSLNL